jgi:hypothetical protein
MAKKTKKTTDNTVVDNTANNTSDNTQETTPVVEETTPVVEETAVTEEVAPVEETPVTEEAAPVAEEVAPVVSAKSARETFEEAISKTPYAIYQNGIMICHSNPHLTIKTENKYFEINYRKFSYAGIEVKHK